MSCAASLAAMQGVLEDVFGLEHAVGQRLLAPGRCLDLGACMQHSQLGHSQSGKKSRCLDLGACMQPCRMSGFLAKLRC